MHAFSAVLVQGCMGQHHPFLSLINTASGFDWCVPLWAVLCNAAVRFSSKIGFQFDKSTQADSFSAEMQFKYNGWGCSVSAAASYARSRDNSKESATLTAERDFLPIGYQVG